MNRIKLLLIGLIVSIGSFSACNNDDSNNPSNPVDGIIVQGTWRITLFSESGVVETQQFNGYNFTFNSNGTVMAINGASTVPGTWSTDNDDDSQDDLTLAFGIVSPFDELNEDWHILENTATKIRLQHISGGNGGTDLLTFEKN